MSIYGEYRQSRRATAYVFCLFSGFIAGALVELYGNRLVTTTGTLMAILGFVLTAFTKQVGVLFLTYSILTGKETIHAYNEHLLLQS